MATKNKKRKKRSTKEKNVTLSSVKKDLTKFLKNASSEEIINLMSEVASKARAIDDQQLSDAWFAQVPKITKVPTLNYQRPEVSIKVAPPPKPVNVKKAQKKIDKEFYKSRKYDEKRKKRYQKMLKKAAKEYDNYKKRNQKVEKKGSKFVKVVKNVIDTIYKVFSKSSTKTVNKEQKNDL